VIKAPTRDPSDFCIAHRAKSALFIPEVAKSMSTPERFQHVVSFAFLEVGLTRRIVRVGFASGFYVSFNGYATREQQPHFNWLPLLLTCFPEEEPVTTSMPGRNAERNGRHVSSRENNYENRFCEYTVDRAPESRDYART
jgi:hypothetical protein